MFFFVTIENKQLICKRV